MALLQYAEAGAEYLIPWAKTRLTLMHDAMARSGVRVTNKTIYASDGAVIYLNALYLGGGQFKDSIRITATGGYVIADPFYPLWGVSGAVMPGTRAGVIPALAWSPLVQHITAYYPNTDGSYLRRHWLVVCRYCARVAQYTWDETGVWVNGALIRTGQYISHAADGTAVTLRDFDAASVATTRTVAISPSLTAASDANPWGWITGAGANPPHPGSPPPDGTCTVRVTIAHEYPPQTPPSAGWPTGNPTVVDNSTVTFDVVRTVDSAVLASSSVSGTFTFSVPAFGVIVHVYSGEFFNLSNVFVPAGTYTDTGGVWVPSAPPSIPLASNSTYAAAFTDATDRTAVAVEAQRQYNVVLVASVKALVSAVTAAMDAKKFTAPDATEVRPYDGAIDHRRVSYALAIPAYSAAQYTISCGSGGAAVSATMDYNSALNAVVIPGSVYGASVALSDPAVPPPPAPPWAVTIGNLVSFAYHPSLRSFTAAAPMPVVNAYFSRGAALPVVLGQTAALGNNGFYRTSAATGFAPFSPVGLADLMKRLCVGVITAGELSRVVYQGLRAPDAVAVAYRATEHTYSSGLYTHTQPIIPPR